MLMGRMGKPRVRRSGLVLPLRRLTIALLAAALASSCANQPDLDALDADVGGGRAAWNFNRGTACDFQAETAICVSGTDEGRNRNVTVAIVSALSDELPGFQNVCDERTVRIRVEYQGSYSLCPDCPAPHLGRRIGLGFVRLESNDARLADADWIDTRGGSAEEVAARFGRELAGFLAGLRGIACAGA
jgi:hypothetical protein